LRQATLQDDAKYWLELAVQSAVDRQHDRDGSNRTKLGHFGDFYFTTTALLLKATRPTSLNLR
jgi:hypothetical protein